MPLEKDMFVEPALVLMLNIPRIHVRPETIAHINVSGLEKILSISAHSVDTDNREWN